MKQTHRLKKKQMGLSAWVCVTGGMRERGVWGVC